MISLDWRNIRPLNGNQSSGFEELCAQIARSASPDDSDFVRKGVPDAGVECYAVLSDGTEWGWQAKYFFMLDDSQWAQLDKSVSTALDKHPKLIKYHICVPLDRPDARIDNRQSCMERWNAHEEKWLGWAKERGLNVEFVWRGSSELLELLSEPQRAGCVSFWFDTRHFTDAWFRARLDEALASAGPRYTPELNIDLPIQGDFEAFGRTELFFDRVKAQARPIREKLSSLRFSLSRLNDSEISDSSAALFTCVEGAIDRVSALRAQPTEEIPFRVIIDQLIDAYGGAERLETLLDTMDRKGHEQTVYSDEETGPTSYGYHPHSEFDEPLYRLRQLAAELREAGDALTDVSRFANSSLLLLTGEAGTGKTHLLCDVARLRVEACQPTLLLMGQRFVGATDPWTQVLEHVDLRDHSVEQLIGALDAAAQSAGCRAMVLLDALNEGEGRTIWPSHLPAFLAQLQRSPWISVVLSVRSTYEDLVIPESIKSQATDLVHYGFANHEYDATKTFFVHYGLELPSTPLLSPEFRNPLFLKTLCLGLNASGQHRLPRGFHGISRTFDLYLSAIDARLAARLDYNPRALLVSTALDSVARVMVDAGERWLTVGQAADIVDAFLPGRDYARSLYRGLVTEGILVEESISSGQNGRRQEVVFIGYERLADHLVTHLLLDTHLTPDDPEGAFAPEGPLAFLYDKTSYVSAGLLEAMCIQIPERTGRELVSLAPTITASWNLREAFRQSLVWRAMAAFSDETVNIMRDLIGTEYDFHATLDMLLTVASIPEHPLNAERLHKRLSKDSMPERDSWWSTYLHRAWDNRGAVDRLVDWAASVDADMTLDDDSVSLCAIALTWMLTTSNRFLRDRAAKALVSLLSGRFNILLPLLDRFRNVNDPYVLERLHAAAYGVAMRSHDATNVGVLAEKVYEHIFSEGTPPAHILLRDYARGTVERALYLGVDIRIDESRMRPPYGSKWPDIPSEAETESLLQKLSSEGGETNDDGWACSHIVDSVLRDDFARYVIGTNVGHSEWLSVRLSDPCWFSRDERLKQFVDGLSSEEKAAYGAIREAREHLVGLQCRRMFALPDEVGRGRASANENSSEGADHQGDNQEEMQAKAALSDATSVLVSTLTEGDTRQLEEILAAQEDHAQSHPPYFDLRLIQRYVLWRVFDLGWTTERFGKFDRVCVTPVGRSASKAERIGKKYQWIAYHEIMAFVADNFQFFEGYGGECTHRYDGPWQLGLRDIDPSCTLRSTPGGTRWDGHSPAWWGRTVYDDWGHDDDPEGWVLNEDDLPSLEELIRVRSPNDGSIWVNVDGYFEWESPVPPDQETRDVERRDLWYIFNAYLIRKADLTLFMDWAKQNSFSGRWMPEPPHGHLMFFGEHGWSPASHSLDTSGWHQVGCNCPVEFRLTSLGFLEETSTFDCSMDDTFSLRMPDKLLMAGLGLKWTSRAADFMDKRGRLVCWDPTAHAPGPTALLIREDSLRRYLEREGLAIVWAVIGEKQAFGPGWSPDFIGELSISGAYTLVDGGLDGFLNSAGRLAKDP